VRGDLGWAAGYYAGLWLLRRRTRKHQARNRAINEARQKGKVEPVIKTLHLECDRCGKEETIEEAGTKPMPWGQMQGTLVPPFGGQPRQVMFHLCPPCSQVSDPEVFGRPKKVLKASGADIHALGGKA
jgi:hypothetical protein